MSIQMRVDVRAMKLDIQGMKSEIAGLTGIFGEARKAVIENMTSILRETHDRLLAIEAMITDQDKRLRKIERAKE